MKWQLVPVEPTPEMQKAGAEVPLNKAARHNVVFRRMLEAAPQPPALTDERILEITMSDDVSLVEYQGPGVRPRITVHNSIGGVYALARAIEREILGGGETGDCRMTDKELLELAQISAYRNWLVSIAESLGIHSQEFTSADIDDKIDRLQHIEAAARNLAKVKGRHNSELAMNQLLEALK